MRIKTFKLFANVTRALNTAHKNSHNLEQEYSLLKALNNVLDKNIKFDDFSKLSFTYIPRKHVIVLRCKELNCHRIININDLNSFKVWPGMLADFLRVNGANEVDEKGKAILPKKPYMGGLYRSPGKQSDTKWTQGDKGFWKLRVNE